jgi:molecular chaperone DnaK
MSSPLYLGIDLGTTNSAAAVFDGTAIQSVRTGQGGLLTPSVVRLDRKGAVSVGAKARRLLETDPANTRAEFKRLMGTEQRFEFPAAGVSRSAIELSSLILASLRSDVEAQWGVAPTRAVISVPALFELPQTNATSEAARLAGFEQVEMIQEPVASALAAGWKQDEDDRGLWLVYDLGGGTFDVSLLETQEGLLRVVAHDGDNFLGGRDFDGQVLEWMLDRWEAAGEPIPDRTNPAHGAALRQLRLLAEEAKIELTRAASATISPVGIEVDGQMLEAELELQRDELEALVEPLIARTLEVCSRLLRTKGMSQEKLSRVVLVGGPTVIPYLRRRVSETLQAPIAENIDPMTVVAQGAALFAATANLDARPEPPKEPTSGVRLWLQHPTVTGDATPFVAGKVVSAEVALTAVRFERSDGAWRSEDEAIGEDGTFVAMLQLLPRSSNHFEIYGVNASGSVAVTPHRMTIVHGVALSEPPLSRSVGVALANNSVQVYADRGAPLPLKRTFTHRTTIAVSPGIEGYALSIPIVQGEYPWAHLCRVVGTLQIPSAQLRTALPAGSAVEVTIELDRGGRMWAQAHVPALKQVFDHVAHLVIAGSSPEQLAQALALVSTRLSEQLAHSFRDHRTTTLARLSGLKLRLDEAAALVELGKGGDQDALQRAQRLVLEVTSELDEVDDASAWPKLEQRVDDERASTLGWIGGLGTAQERATADRIGQALDRALAARNANEVERQLRLLRHLANSAYFRSPDAWMWQFEAIKHRVAESTDPRQASALVVRGERALKKDDRAELEATVRALWQLMPDDEEDRKLSHGSGVR